MGREHFQSLIRSNESCDTAGDEVHLDDVPESPALVEDIEQDLQSADTLTNVVMGLEQLHAVLGYVSEASLEHLALVDTALQLAQIHTPAELHEPAIASLESYQGTAISTESLRERIGQIIAYIRKLIRNIVEKIKGFFGAIKRDSLQQRARLSLAYDMHRELQGRFPKRPTVKLGQTAYMIAAPRIPRDGRELIRTVGHLEGQMRSLRTKYVPLVRSVGTQLQAALTSPALKAGDYTNWLQGLNDATSAMQVDSLRPILQPLMRMVDDRYVVNSAWTAPPIPGGRAVVLHDGAVVRPGDDPVSVASARQKTGFSVVRPFQARQVDISQAEMITMNHSMIGEVLAHTTSLIEEIEQVQKQDLRRELEGMEQQISNLEKQISAEHDTGVGVISTGLKYSTAFSTWCSSPYLRLASHSLSVTNALIATCNKHMAAFR